MQAKSDLFLSNVRRAGAMSFMPAGILLGIGVWAAFSDGTPLTPELPSIAWAWAAATTVMVLGPAVAPSYFPGGALHVWKPCPCGSEVFFASRRCMQCRTKIGVPKDNRSTFIVWVGSLLAFFAIYFAQR